MTQRERDIDNDTRPALREGATFGRWRLRERIGKGGFGEVWLAHAGNDETAAVKLLSDDAGRDRFEREYRLALGQDGLFTARVLDADIDAAQPWIAFEPLSAETLFYAAPLAEADLRPFAVDLWLAIASLHHAGIAHRDVSAGNVFLSESRVRLIDFGLARQDTKGEPGPSRLMIGSPGFAAPEQMHGEVGVSMEADIWAWGAVCYFASTGRTYRERAGELDELAPWLRSALTVALSRDPAARSRERIIECIARNESELFSLRNALTVLELQGQAAQSPERPDPGAAPPTAPAAAAEIASLREEVRQFVEERQQPPQSQKRSTRLVPLAIVFAIAAGAVALWAVLRADGSNQDELTGPESASVAADVAVSEPVGLTSEVDPSPEPDPDDEIEPTEESDAEPPSNDTATGPPAAQPLSALFGAPETTNRGTVLGTDHPGAMSIPLDQAGCTDSEISYTLDLPAGEWEASGTVGLSDMTPQDANVRIRIGDAAPPTLTESSRSASFQASGLSDEITMTVEVLSSFGSPCGEMPVEVLVFDSFIR